MLTHLLDNWPYKLAAIAIAIALRLYVIDQSNNTRQIMVPISNLVAPAGLVVADAPRSVRVTLSGASGRLDTVTPDDLHASLDLRAARSGNNASVPVVASLSTDLQGVVSVVDQDPRSCAVVLDKLVSEQRKISVHMNVTQFATFGYAYQSPIVTPATAVIEGTDSDLAKVKDVWVWVDTDFSGSEAGALSIQGYYNISAMDAFGNPVTGVTVSPTQARVVIPVTRVAAIKTMVVSPQIVGSPSYPFAIKSVTVDPPMVTISGPASVLADTSIIGTQAIDVSGVNGNIQRSVSLILPKSLVAKPAGNVTVTVTISATRPPSPPVAGGTTLHT